MTMTQNLFKEQISQMSDATKSLRHKVAFITGLIRMREDLDNDIVEAMAQMGKEPTPQPAEQTHLLPAPNESGTVNHKSRMSDAVRAARSLDMKRRWKVFHQAGGTGMLAAAPPKQSGNGTAKRGRPRKHPLINAVPAEETPEPLKKSRKKKQLKRRYPHSTNPSIGFGTNAEFIYECAAANGNMVDYAVVKTLSKKSRNHRNLITGTRLSVAIADMKRKNLLTYEGTGHWALTPQAHETYRQERAEQSIQQ